MQLRLLTQNNYTTIMIAEHLDLVSGEDLAVNMTVGLFGLASLSWMTLSLLKRLSKEIPVITGLIQLQGLISRTTVVIHTLRQSGPDSSNELIKIRCTSLTGKSQESPRTTIQKGTSSHQDMSLKGETLLA